MGHHIDEKGRFQSDKFPHLPSDYLALSFHDQAARPALELFAALTTDAELREDVVARLDTVKQHPKGVTS